MAPKTLENRILRIETYLGLEELPSSWGVTNSRINNLKNKGYDEKIARQKLIESLGEPIEEED